MPKRKFLLLFFIFLVVQILSFYIFNTFNKEETNQYLNNKTTELEIKQRAVQYRYNLLIKTIISQNINRPNILKLYSKAFISNNIQKEIIRNSLFNMLLPVYEYLKSSNIEQLHFHLPNNESFLRFHNPAKYGDNLSDVKYLVKMVNQNKKHYFGSEAGGLFLRFRDIYPLFYENEHIGSVEISFSFNSIKKQLQQHDKNTYAMIVKKDIIKTKKENYHPSLLSDDYMSEKKYSHHNNDSLNIFKEIDKNIKTKIANNLANNKNFSIQQRFNNEDYIISFISVNNIRGEAIAYIFSYQKDNIVSQKNEKYISIHIIRSILLAIIFLFILFVIIRKEKLLEIDKNYKAILDSNPDVVFMTNIEHKCVYFNKQIENLFNYSQTELLNTNLINIVPTNEIVTYHVNFEAAFLKKHLPVFETLITHKNGSHIPIEISGKIVKYEDEIVLVGTMRDIKKRIEARQDLIKAKEKAEESDHLKSSFIANMSHEIRTPMNAILGFSSLLLKKDKSEKQKEHFIDTIIKNGKLLTNLINNIIDLSKLDSNQLSVSESEFNLNLLLLQLKETFIEKANKNVEITINNGFENENDTIITDHVRLLEILTNLTENAVKFTHSGFIEIGYLLQNNSTLKFWVKDSGIGISEEEIKFVFNRFRQADESSTREYGGTGLGLALSKAYAELLGGKIWVESELRKGSTFYFTIKYNVLEE